MELLIKGTTAYKVFEKDGADGRLSHAYLLHFSDSANSREVCKIFAKAVFSDWTRVKSESLPDLKIYPPEGKKYTAEGVGALIADSALKPVGGDKKLYILLNFETASPLVQNKLLKTLEEPLAGVHFLLCAASLSPVLDTVKSRAKLLEIAPFSPSEILSVLEREGSYPLNAAAAESCNGVLGTAQSMVRGEWFSRVAQGAREICSASAYENIAPLADKYGDIPYKKELLSEMQRLYFKALSGEDEISALWQKPTLIYALEKISACSAALTFNAYFKALLYDFMSGVLKENGKWLKLQA